LFFGSLESAVAQLFSLGIVRAMKPMTTFQICWVAGGKQQVSRFPAASASDARRAFDSYKLPGVRIVSIEPVEPDAAAERVPSHSPDSPFDPLIARRRLDIDEDVR
jgi:hypothetical protein